MRHDHPRDCTHCWNNDEHAVLEYEPMTDQDIYEAINSTAYLLGGHRGLSIDTSTWAAISRKLNSLALIADDRYQAARKAGR